MKIVDNYLDKYYSRKLAYALQSSLVVNFMAKTQVARNGFGMISIQAKRKNLKDEFYTEIYAFYQSEAIWHLCNFKEMVSYLHAKYRELMDYQRDL